jgi:hypothetical protein
LNLSLNAAFRAVRLELMASFRSAFTAGQLTRNAPAVLWREVRYVLGSCGAREEWKTQQAAANQ